jgi:hypothetical protein
MSDKVQKFLSTVMSHFAKRHATEIDEKNWVMSMVDGLRGYDASVLDRAAHKIILTRRDPGFPYLSQCRDACEQIIKLDRAERTPKLDEQARRPFNDKAVDHAFRLADELIVAGAIGKTAAREGWALSLHDFVRLNGRLPTEKFEIEKCKASARGFDEAYEKVLNGGGGACTKALEALGDSMLKKRHKYEDMILRGQK